MEGSPTVVSQAQVYLYSGPSANFHTDRCLGQRLGHADAIAQGLMAMALECQLHREVFGAGWYAGGVVEVRYIKPSPAGSTLTPIVVIVARTSE
jgi:acyl dehydratase